MGTNYKELHSLQEQVRRCTGDLRFSSQAWQHHHSSTILQQSGQLEARVHTAHDTSFPNKVVCRTLQWAPLMISCWRKKKRKDVQENKRKAVQKQSWDAWTETRNWNCYVVCLWQLFLISPFHKEAPGRQVTGWETTSCGSGCPFLPLPHPQFPSLLHEGWDTLQENWWGFSEQLARSLCPVRLTGVLSQVSGKEVFSSHAQAWKIKELAAISTDPQIECTVQISWGKKKHIKKVFQQGWDVFKHLNASVLITQKENIAMMQETPRTATGCNAI